MTSGQISCDLWRLRIHGLIERIPGTFRYHVPPAGIRQALFLTRLTQRLLITGLAELAPPDPPCVPGSAPPSAPTTQPSTISPGNHA